MQAQGRQTNRAGRGAGRDRSGLGSRRVVWTSFGISVALHLLFIGLYPAYGTLERDNPNLPSPDFTVSSDALELLRLIEAELASDSERPEDPNEIEAVESPDVTPDPLVLEAEPGLEFTPPPLTGAELLRPRLTDERLWRPIDLRLTDLSLEQREELALRGRIADFVDSLEAAQAAEARLTDWTFTDSDGKRWGVADGKIIEIGNLDATIIAEVPRLAPHQSAMRGRLAAALGVEEARVNLKITSSDGLGALGRGEGIGALAVVLLVSADDAPGAAEA